MNATITRLTVADIVASIAHKRGLSTDPADLLADHLSILCEYQGDDVLRMIADLLRDGVLTAIRPII
ncbi:hypothetical protein ASF69_01445 [Rhizobium sp. Leaf311]|uniref:hypothetical protein n=1 Tax=Rhizobium sp. Leaf311 TaxID=1736332 RepID=UPI00071524AB|nr:hypothetical protein [Rhizobium sp. Leaf311]KQQ61114.1 hypothetical protein ASF69_01445 [Rhizobium sp. Leaf311]